MKKTLLSILIAALVLPAAWDMGEAVAASKSSRKLIATEWQRFAVSGTKTVRFGTTTRWVEKQVSGSGVCSVRFFGRDPAPYQFKSCTVQKSSKKKSSGGSSGSGSSGSSGSSRKTLSVNTLGTGLVTSTPAGISCGASCTAQFSSSQTVVLSASAGSGFVFAGWSGPCSGIGSCSLKMSSSRVVGATFRQIVDGSCGEADGKSFSSAPSDDLCSTGDVSSVESGETGYAWTCAGTSGGTTVSCQAEKVIIPATALLLRGPSTAIAGVASDTFTVSGDGVFAREVVVRPVSGDGSFNPAAVTLSTTNPTGTFRYTAATAGTKAIALTNDGSLTNPAALAVSVANPPVDGTCGSSDSQSLFTPPSANLCTAGTASSVTTNASTYTWSCAGSDGGLTAGCAATRLIVPTATISSSSTTIAAGQATTLTWSSTNATSCTASGSWSGTKAASGTESVSPGATATYSITCTGAGGTTSAQSVTITVTAAPQNGSCGSSQGGSSTTPPSTNLCSVGTASSVTTNASTYTWNCAGTNGGTTASCSATRLIVTNGSCGSSNGGSFSTAPTTNLCTAGTASSVTTNASTYTWNCTGANGGTNASCSATRLVTPTATISVSPTTITAGQTTTVTWSSTNATSCTASNGWSGAKTVSGSEALTPGATTTYAVSCTGAGGASTTQSATVTVNPAPQNGSCGSSQGGSSTTPPSTNLCSVGTASSVTTNASTYTWNCAGTNGGTTASCSATRLIVTNGSCGSSNGGSFSTAPTTNLCTAGTASGVTTNASTYTWNCTGANGGTTASCSATRVAPPTLTLSGPTLATIGVPSAAFTVSTSGSLSGTVTATPSSNGGGGTFNPTTLTLNATTTTATFTYTPTSTGTKTISITNNGGLTNPGSLELTVADTVNGLCGTSHTQSFSTAPTNNLCSSGTASSVTTNASTYTWNCAGTNGGTTASCSATRLIVTNGSCGSSNGGSFSTAPTTNLCTAGTASGVTTNASTYTWNCTGANGGTTASCSATRLVTPTATISVSPTTITAGQTTTVTWSSTNATSCTISNGTQSADSGTNGSSATPALSQTTTYTLTCTGANGSATASATVTVEAPVTTNGSCGSSSGASFSTAPTTNLCTAGTASSVTTNASTYTWNCAGTNGGTTASCSATRTIPAATALTLSGPTSGTVNQASTNFTVSANGSLSTTITVTPSSNGGGGTFNPTTLTLNATTTTATFTYTPTSTGTKTLSITNSGSLANPGSISYTVNTVPTQTTGIKQFVTHDGDMVGEVDNSSAPSRDFWNNVLKFRWKRGGWGDWLDSQQRPFGDSTAGATPYASFAVPQPGNYSASVTSLVNRWLTTGENRGFYLRLKNNSYPVRFAGRTDANASRRPVLTIVTSTGTYDITARANAWWNMSTYRILSRSDYWELSSQQPAILHFNLDGVTGTVQSATLKVTDIYHEPNSSSGNGVVDVFEADPPQFTVPNQVASPELGFAYNLPNFQAIASQPATIFSDDFATPGPFDSGWNTPPQRTLNPATNTTYARGEFVAGANDSATNKRLAMKGAGGDGGQGMDVQRDELYSQYHLYLEDDYGSTTDGIKIPAMGTQFGYWRTYNGGYWQMTTGNGGAPGTGLKVYNAAQNRWEYEGHSVRIVTNLRAADDSEYADLFSLNLYPYNLDQQGPFPDMEQFPYVAIQKGNWYAIDLYMKMNSMAGTRDANGNYATANPDGVYKVWINGHPSFTKNNFRWRKHPEFGVEGFWLDFYHGGVQPAPYNMHYRVDRVSMATSYIGPQQTELGGGTPTPQNGSCGSSSGASFSTAPTTNLCTAGTASSVTTNASTYTWNCAGTNGGTTASCSATRTIPAATALTLSGPTSGTVNQASTNFTVSANGSLSTTITVTPSSNGGGGTFNPTTLTLNATTTTATFTYTPTSTGTKTLSITNSGSLANPAALTYTSNAVVSSLPSWVPAPGEVATLTQSNGKITNQFESQAAPYYDAFHYVKTVNDYSGAFKNPYWGEWGATVFWGGGHAGTNDNTVTVAEYGQNAITFKRVSDPTPWTGSTSTDATNKGSNSVGDFNGTTLNLTYMEGSDGQPGSPHSYSSGDIVGPEHGGAQYGSLVQIAASAVNYRNDAGAVAAHKIDFDTTTLQKSNGQNRKWTRITDNRGPGGFMGASPHYTAFVPAQNRIYYAASSGSATRWFDRTTNTYVTGTGTGFDFGPSDGFDSGSMFYVPSRNLLVAMYPQGNQLKVQWMDVSVNQPTLGGTATLSQNLAVSDPWSAATWVPDNNRIVLIGVTGDNGAAYEIEIPANLNSTWPVTRAPFGAGQTFSPYDPTVGIGLTYKKFQYDEKVKSIVYMPRANRDGADETIWVYRPRGT